MVVLVGVLDDKADFGFWIKPFNSDLCMIGACVEMHLVGAGLE